MIKYIRIILIVALASLIYSQESYVDSTKIKNPKIAWKLGFIPGAGQIYNGKYLKAASFVAFQGYATSQFVQFKNDGKIAKRNTYGWWIFGLYVFGILDAYVDAQLSTFPAKIPSSDPIKPPEQTNPEPDIPDETKN